MIAIIDCGRNNVLSVRHALLRVGAQAEIVTTPDRVSAAAGVVLPGVGSFPAGMLALQRAGLVSVIREVVARGTAVLGICLGMQMLFESSEESGLGSCEDVRGLGAFPGRIRRLRGPGRVPHMGWNTVHTTGGRAFLESLDGTHMYFAHSYCLPLTGASHVAAVTDYGGPFVSVVQRANVMGTQFHPEKSGVQGLKLLRRFADIAEGDCT
jgi:imidazole glycerol-phosphate synthase subunit HisH